MLCDLEADLSIHVSIHPRGGRCMLDTRTPKARMASRSGCNGMFEQMFPLHPRCQCLARAPCYSPWCQCSAQVSDCQSRFGQIYGCRLCLQQILRWTRRLNGSLRCSNQSPRRCCCSQLVRDCSLRRFWGERAGEEPAVAGACAVSYPAAVPFDALRSTDASSIEIWAAIGV